MRVKVLMLLPIQMGRCPAGAEGSDVSEAAHDRSVYEDVDTSPCEWGGSPDQWTSAAASTRRCASAASFSAAFTRSEKRVS